MNVYSSGFTTRPHVVNNDGWRDRKETRSLVINLGIVFTFRFISENPRACILMRIRAAMVTNLSCIII